MTHVVIVGAGMGGLGAALTLAARGLQVTLIERHAAPGGKMRQVPLAGRLIDAGPTVFTMRWVFEALFEQAGLALDEHLELLPSPLLARHGWRDGNTLDLYADLERSTAAIEAFAGAREAQHYRAFAAECEAIFHTLDARFMRAQRPNPLALSLGNGLGGAAELLRTRPFESLWNALGKRFDDPRLRQLFGRYSTYCGSSPLQAPATLMLIAHVERAGVWRVRGGMHALARALRDAIVAAGAHCRFDTDVSRIVTIGKRVSGVVLGDGEQLNCDAVIFNGDSAALNAGLLGESLRKATPARHQASLSAVTECRVARTAGFPLAHHNVFFGTDYVDEFTRLFEHGTLTGDPTVYVCAQDRGDDGDTVPADGERLLCLVNAPARTLGAAMTDTAVQRMRDSLQGHGLTLHDTGDPAVVTAPEDFNTLFPASDGALYGRPTHGWMGSFQRPGARSRIRGLYLAGGSVHPGAGVPMATLSGRLAAERLCRDYRVD